MPSSTTDGVQKPSTLVLVLGLSNAAGGVVLIGPDRDVPPGGRLH